MIDRDLVLEEYFLSQVGPDLVQASRLNRDPLDEAHFVSPDVLSSVRAILAEQRTFLGEQSGRGGGMEAVCRIGGASLDREIGVLDREQACSEHELMKAELTYWLSSLQDLGREARVRAIVERFAPLFESGDYEAFYGVLRALGSIDIPLKGRSEAGYSPEDIFMVVDLEFEVMVTLIQEVVQGENHEPPSEWLEFLRQKNENRVEDREFNLKAGIVRDSEKMGRIKRIFKERKVGYVDALKAFKTLIRECWGNNYEGYYTAGTTNAFTILQNEFFGRFPKGRIYYTPYEYGSMTKRLKGQRRKKKIDMKDESVSEEDIVKWVEEDAKYTGTEHEPFVILISSEFRGGKRVLDVRKMARLVAAENAKPENRMSDGTKKFHLWIDAAQDNREFVSDEDGGDWDFHPENPELNVGDAIFYSKRVGGEGLVLMHKATYPSDEDISHTLSEVSGGLIKEEALMSIILALRINQSRMAHRLRDLWLVPDLWRYRGGGQFMAWEQSKMQEAIKTFPLMSRYFDLVIQERPDEPWEWQEHRIMQFSLRGEDTTGLVNYLVQTLAERGFGLESFSLRDEPEFSFLWDADLETENAYELMRKTQEWESYYASRFLVSLLPANRKMKQPQLARYIQERVGQHDVIRFMMNVLQPAGYGIQILKEMEDILGSPMTRAYLDGLSLGKKSMKPLRFGWLERWIKQGQQWFQGIKA